MSSFSYPHSTALHTHVAAPSEYFSAVFRFLTCCISRKFSFYQWHLSGNGLLPAGTASMIDSEYRNFQSCRDWAEIKARDGVAHPRHQQAAGCLQHSRGRCHPAAADRHRGLSELGEKFRNQESGWAQHPAAGYRDSYQV